MAGTALDISHLVSIEMHPNLRLFEHQALSYIHCGNDDPWQPGRPL
jgi:hypothetical protein